jgi:hypothetical protein
VHPARISDQAVTWFWEVSKLPESVEIGLFVPRLRKDGWWKIESRVSSGQTWRGDARFCLWRNLFPDPGAETMPAFVEAKRARRRWDLTVSLLIPPSERAEATAPAPASPVVPPAHAVASREAPLRAGGPVSEARRLEHVEPVFADVLPKDVPSAVIVEWTITREGRMADVRVLRAIPRFDSGDSRRRPWKAARFR